ncbi:protein containing AIR synthase related protein, partial [mine drainage metagenome]
DALLRNNIVLAAHDISDGGFLSALAEMTFGKSIGASVDLSETGGGRPINKLFAESGNRIIVEVSPDGEEKLSSLFTITLKKIGTTGGSRILIENINVSIIDLGVEDARKAWSEGFSSMI